MFSTVTVCVCYWYRLDTPGLDAIAMTATNSLKQTSDNYIVMDDDGTSINSGAVAVSVCEPCCVRTFVTDTKDQKRELCQSFYDSHISKLDSQSNEEHTSL